MFEKILSPYQLVVEEVKEGKLDPYDVDVFHLIELFQEKAKELKSSELLKEAGLFLEASVKLMKLQMENIFPPPKKERKKITIAKIEEVLTEDQSQEGELDLSWMYEYSPKVGRPKGRKDSQERKLSWKEFWEMAKKESVPLHKEVNYSELARKYKEKIKKGEFKIRSLRDFLVYLHAFYEFEDVPELKV